MPVNELLTWALASGMALLLFLAIVQPVIAYIHGWR